MIHGNQRYRRAKGEKYSVWTEQLLAFVGAAPGESRNPIQDGEDREIFFRTGSSY